MIKLPSKVDINNLIDDLRILSWEAGDLLLFYSQKIRNLKNKSEIIKNKDIENPVTIADLKVNELIIQRINEKYKEVNWEILSEENVKIFGEDANTNTDWMWVLDPLDGTKDFIQGTKNYAMHLALNYKNKPYIGIVLIPEKEELWFGDSKNVWCEKRDGYLIRSPKSNKKNLKEMTLVISNNHRNQTLKNLIDKINFKKVVVMGSIGCKIASIIRGESDLYICLSLPGQSSPKDWDFAAPAAILKDFGGAITNLENEELVYNQSKFEQSGIVIASNNKENHKNICLQIKKIIQENNIYAINS